MIYISVKNYAVLFLCTKEEKDRIIKDAHSVNMTVTQYLRVLTGLEGKGKLWGLEERVAKIEKHIKKLI